MVTSCLISSSCLPRSVSGEPIVKLPAGISTKEISTSLGRVKVSWVVAVSFRFSTV